MNRDVIRQKIGQSFKVRPLPTFYTTDGSRLPFRDDFWVLRHVSDAEVEFRNRRIGVAFKIGLMDLKEIRIPDYFILNCDITLEGKAVTVMSRKSPNEEIVRR